VMKKPCRLNKPGVGVAAREAERAGGVERGGVPPVAGDDGGGGHAGDAQKLLSACGRVGLQGLDTGRPTGDLEAGRLPVSGARCFASVAVGGVEEEAAGRAGAGVSGGAGVGGAGGEEVVGDA